MVCDEKKLMHIQNVLNQKNVYLQKLNEDSVVK